MKDGGHLQDVPSDLVGAVARQWLQRQTAEAVAVAAPAVMASAPG